MSQDEYDELLKCALVTPKWPCNETTEQSLQQLKLIDPDARSHTDRAQDANIPDIMDFFNESKFCFTRSCEYTLAVLTNK